MKSKKPQDVILNGVSPDSKAQRGDIILKASIPFIEDESRWNEVAGISGNLMKILAVALFPYLETMKQLLASE